MALPSKPITRQETYLSNIAGQATQLPDAPITREEKYLDYIAKNGGGGGTGEGDMKKSAYDADEAVFNAGGIKAFVNSSISGKVDKVEGKGLSSNDYDDSAKAIVDNVTSALDGKVSKSNTAGLLKNDGTVDTNTYAQTSALSGYIAKSETAGLVKNDGTIDTTTTGAVSANTSAISAIKDGTTIDSFGDVESALSGYIAKSNTAGLVKNDGTIDTTKYASQNALATVAKLFNSTASYTEGDYVIYNEELYQCETNHTGAWNADHFRKYLAGVANLLKYQYAEAATIAYPFSPDSNYKKGDYVTYNNGYMHIFYRFTQDHSGAWNASHVEQVKAFEELKALQATAFPRSEQAVMGAVNFWNTTLISSGSSGGYTYAVDADDRTIHITGGHAVEDAGVIECGTVHLEPGTYYLSGAIGGTSQKLGLQVWASSASTDQWYLWNGEEVVMNLTSAKDCKLRIYFHYTLSNVDVTFKPMIALGPNQPYAPFAMTNKQLTEKKQEKVIYNELTVIDLTGDETVEVNNIPAGNYIAIMRIQGKTDGVINTEINSQECGVFNDAKAWNHYTSMAKIVIASNGKLIFHSKSYTTATLAQCKILLIPVD